MELLRQASTKKQILGGRGSISRLRRGPALQNEILRNRSFLAATRQPTIIPSTQPSLAWFSTDKPDEERKQEAPRPRNIEIGILAALEERTEEFLDVKKIPVGSVDLEAFRGARKLIWEWLDLGTPRSVTRSLDLLDRLVAEQNLNFHADFTEEKVSALLNFSLLNHVVRNWSNCYKKIKDDSLISPQALLEKMEAWAEQYPNMAPETETMHYIMLGAVSRVETVEDAEYIESLLMRMLEDFQAGNIGIAPSLMVYNILLNAMAKVGQAERAEDLLRRLCDDYNSGVSMLRPDAVSFGTVLYAYKRAALEHGGQRAEALLDTMIEFGEMEGVQKMAQPDRESYASVLEAWCAPKTMHCLEQAERFLQRMHDDYQAGNDAARPAAANYGLVIHSLSMSGRSEEAERILRWMHNDYVQNGNEKAQPTPYHFNPVISSWARKGNTKGMDRAFSVFESMQHTNVEPDGATYGALIFGLSRSKDNSAGNRAEQLLREQQHRYRAGNEACKPDAMTFNAAMHCWSIVGNAQRAVALLSELVEEHKRGTVQLTDDRPYCTALAALSRSRYSDKTQIAEKVFQELKNLSEAGVLNFQPSTASYGAMLGCWASAELPESGQNCLALLHEMQARYVAGEKSMRPKERQYKAVIDAFARIRKPDQAEAVWVEMLQSSLEGNPDAKPGRDSCRSLLAGWLMSGAADAIERVLDLMDRIAEIDRTGKIDLKLDKDSYYILFQECAKSKNPDITAGAEQILRKMKEIHEEGCGAMGPDSRCYNVVINCWGKVGNADRAEALFWEMYNEFVDNGNQAVRPDAFTISTVLGAWSKSGNENATRRAEVFFERIEKLMARGNLPHAKLDSVCYDALLNCLAKARTDEATETAERLFASMQQRYKAGDTSARPTRSSYDVLLRCRLRVGHIESAENLVFAMHERFMSGERELEPTYRVCKPVLNGWMSSDNEDTPVRAERFLRWMNQNSQEMERPDVLAYASLLRCWARSRRPDAGHRTEMLMTEIVQKFGHTRPLVKDCFSDVVCAWARASNLERAEELLLRLCDEYLNDRTDCGPETRAFVAVLAAMSRAKPVGVGMRCLRVVQALRDVENARNGQKAAPSKVLECWNRMSTSDEDRLQFFLSQMEEFDTPDQAVKAPAAATEDVATDNYSLAFKS